MIELDITDAYRNMIPKELSASAAELGHCAWAITWIAALEYAEDYPNLLDTQEKVDAAREHFMAYGAWGENEILKWSKQELTASVFQDIGADIRESVLEKDPGNWYDYYLDSAEGFSRGRLFEKGGRVFYYLGE